MDRTCTYLDSRLIHCCTECGVTVEICTCADPDDKAYQRIHSDDGRAIKMTANALAGLRESLPDAEKTLCELWAQIGHLSGALRKNHQSGETPDIEVFREAIKVAVQAIRVAVDGDDDYRYDPSTILRDYD